MIEPLGEYSSCMTVPELCEALSISRNTCIKLLTTEQIRAVKVFNVWRIPKINVLTFLGLTSNNQSLNEQSLDSWRYL